MSSACSAVHGLSAYHRAQLEHHWSGVTETTFLARGEQAQLWRVASPRGLAVLKVWPDRTQREADVYRVLADPLSPWMVQPLADWPGALLLPWIDGQASPSSIEAHTWAGRVLARLERQPIAVSDEISPPLALARRFEGWWRRGHPWITPAQRDAMERALDLARFRDWPRCWCHRDFEPRNWIRTAHHFVVLDWGQARLDLRGWDRIKLRASDWHDNPALERAFLDGYGTPLPEPAADLDQLTLLHGLQTFVWGHQHADRARIGLGQRILARHLPGVF